MGFIYCVVKNSLMYMKETNFATLIEFPEFGFGPASTSLKLIGLVANKGKCIVISTGSALKFVIASIPGVITIDFDTSNTDRYHLLPEIIDPLGVDRIISNTNPEFANWAANFGYRVIVIDNLFWMWNTPPDCLNVVEKYFYQHYITEHSFELGASVHSNLICVRPIIDYELWGKSEVRSSRDKILIALGGMNIPYGKSLVVEYANWLLPSIVRMLTLCDNEYEINIVGGLLDQVSLELILIENPSVNVFTHLVPREFQQLYTDSKIKILTPGLATIYEAIFTKSTPIFLPGFNLSQILQAYDLRESLGYPKVVSWPFEKSAIDNVKGMPEASALSFLSFRICQFMKSNDASVFSSVVQNLMTNQIEHSALESVCGPVQAGFRKPDLIEMIAQII